MTTLRQKLVRKKNRKLRRLRELYPDLNVKLFYARDFRALMLKYGRLALVDGLSGTSGQVAAPHGERRWPAEADAVGPIRSPAPTRAERRPPTPAPPRSVARPRRAGRVDRTAGR